MWFSLFLSVEVRAFEVGQISALEFIPNRRKLWWHLERAWESGSRSTILLYVVFLLFSDLFLAPVGFHSIFRIAFSCLSCPSFYFDCKLGIMWVMNNQVSSSSPSCCVICRTAKRKEPLLKNVLLYMVLFIGCQIQVCSPHNPKVLEILFSPTSHLSFALNLSHLKSTCEHVFKINCWIKVSLREFWLGEHDWGLGEYRGPWLFCSIRTRGPEYRIRSLDDEKWSVDGFRCSIRYPCGFPILSFNLCNFNS